MVYIYDGSFDGFLTTIFEIYASKQIPEQILCEQNWQPGFFDTVKKIDTNTVYSERVWTGIVSRADVNVARMLLLAHASELPDIEMTVYKYLEKLFADNTNKFYQNLLDDDAFKLYNVARKVKVEIHRFYGFVRFQETSDGLFFAAIDPDHDIVTLLAPHFAARYADQPWVIYDSKRDKGIYYNKKEIQEVTLTDKQFDVLTGTIKSNVKAEDEDSYRKLWKAYYKAISIPERKNTRLMLHFLPRRYWKYLPEKGY